MRLSKNSKLKSIAKATALMLAASSILSGCAAEKEKDDEVYVSSGGSYIPYHTFIGSGGRVSSATRFATSTGNGFSEYKPNASELSSMKSGSFSGKTSRPAITSASGSKGFGGSSSRAFGG